MEKKNIENKMAIDLGNKKGKENIKNLDFYIYIKQKENWEKRFPMFSLIYLFTSNIPLILDVSYKQSALFVREILVNKSSIILSSYTEWNFWRTKIYGKDEFSLKLFTDKNNILVQL